MTTLISFTSDYVLIWCALRRCPKGFVIALCIVPLNENFDFNFKFDKNPTHSHVYDNFQTNCKWIERAFYDYRLDSRPAEVDFLRRRLVAPVWCYSKTLPARYPQKRSLFKTIISTLIFSFCEPFRHWMAKNNYIKAIFSTIDVNLLLESCL